MAIKDIIAPGIGFSPGSVEYIVTRGFDSAAGSVVVNGQRIRAGVVIGTQVREGRVSQPQQIGRGVVQSISVTTGSVN